MLTDGVGVSPAGSEGAAPDDAGAGLATAAADGLAVDAAVAAGLAVAFDVPQAATTTPSAMVIAARRRDAGRPMVS